MFQSVWDRAATDMFGDYQIIRSVNVLLYLLGLSLRALYKQTILSCKTLQADGVSHQSLNISSLRTLSLSQRVRFLTGFPGAEYPTLSTHNKASTFPGAEYLRRNLPIFLSSLILDPH